MLKLGSHVPFKSPNYLLDSSKFSLENKANAMMIFLGAPQNTRRASVDKFKIEEYNKNYAKQIPLENILVHGPYIINPSNPDKNSFAIEFIIKELKMMEKIGLRNYIIHPGAKLKNTTKKALDTCIETLKEVIKNTDNNINILLETMSGKGTEIGWNFEHLSYILKKVNSERIGICLDTCHLFASGIDFGDLDLFKKNLKKAGLLNNIKAMHINNSKMEFGSKKDRHANLQEGFIPFEWIKQLVNDPFFKDVVKVLETPWIEGRNIYKEEIKLLLK